jgi:periplasmic divalent cation tolerance protein
MVNAETCVLIYTTWPDAARAEAAGRIFVAEKLVACVNILGEATAIYEWQGEVQQETECPMLMKTRKTHVGAVIAAVKRLHPYDVPAIAVLPIEGGDPEFLAWIVNQTARQPVSSEDIDSERR